MQKVMVVVKGELMVDFGYPNVQAKRLLNESYEAANSGDFEKAIELAFQALGETKLMINALREFQEKNK